MYDPRKVNAREDFRKKLSTKEGINDFVKSVIFGWGKNPTEVKNEQAQQGQQGGTPSPEPTDK